MTPMQSKRAPFNLIIAYTIHPKGPERTQTLREKPTAFDFFAPLAGSVLKGAVLRATITPIMSCGNCCCKGEGLNLDATP